jgi:putative membrane protein
MSLFMSCGDNRNKDNANYDDHNASTSANVNTYDNNNEVNDNNNVIGTNNNSNEQDRAEEANDEKFDGGMEKDADRLSKAYMLNLYEVMASEKALVKATDAEVKKVAQMMKKEHSKMSSDLQNLASKKNITLPATITDAEKRKIDALNDKTGYDFDKEYTQQMKNKHEDAIKDMERIADKSEDADIRKFASNAIPQLRTHLTMVENCYENVKEKKDNDKKTKDRTSK